MPSAPRIDTLTAPPVPGEFYLVPTVLGHWWNTRQPWPVMGEQHEDEKFFRFREQHYHLDRRFIADKHVQSAVGYPLLPRAHSNDPPLPAPVWRRLKCRRAVLWFPWHHDSVREMQGALAGAQCRRDAAGWICPHRQFSLGSVAPDGSGVIICPLHGLRINAATGRALDIRTEEFGPPAPERVRTFSANPAEWS